MASSSSSGRQGTASSGSIFRLLIDARASFPYDEASAKQKTSSWARTPLVADALAVLPVDEQQRILKYYFPRDAALSLAASLLKHYIVVRALGVSWAASTIQASPDVQNGKPYYAGAGGGLEFNISHHGEGVVLIATTSPAIKTGIDLTRLDPVKDLKAVTASGFAAWVRIFADVFSDGEVKTIVDSVPPIPAANAAAAAMMSPSETNMNAIKGLRMFYAHWALKEAYFKMTGDALLADWLKQLEFNNVQPPSSASASTSAPASTSMSTSADPQGVAAGTTDSKWAVGQITTAGASLRGTPITDTQLELMALGDHYIVASSITSPEPLPPFELVDVAATIMPLARK